MEHALQMSIRRMLLIIWSEGWANRSIEEDGSLRAVIDTTTEREMLGQVIKGVAPHLDPTQLPFAWWVITRSKTGEAHLMRFATEAEAMKHYSEL